MLRRWVGKKTVREARGLGIESHMAQKKFYCQGGTKGLICSSVSQLVLPYMKRMSFGIKFGSNIGNINHE